MGALDDIRRKLLGRSGNDDDDDIFGGMPRGGSSSSSGDDRRQPSTRSPLGVPEGYRTPYTRGGLTSARGAEVWAGAGRGHGTIGAKLPLYYDGDQLRPSMSDPASIGRLQASLAAAGLLEDFRFGVWDKNSQDAYADLLSEANAAGVTWEAQLRNRAASFDFGGGGSSRSGGGGGGGGRWTFDENGEPIFIPDQYVAPPLTLRTTNRDDLVRALRTGIIEKMGVGWNQQQIGELADLYIQKEIQAQQDAYNQQVAIERQAFEQGEGSVSGQVITEATVPSPETFLENELKTRDPIGYQVGTAITDVIPQFAQMLEGWGR